MDVAEDLTAPGLFDLSWDRLRAIADANRPRVKWRHDGTGWSDPPDRRESGRTVYFGSVPMQVMLYEKGFERIQRGGALTADLNWCRLEAKCCPEKREGKLMLAELTPLDVFGLSGWSSAMLAAFTGTEAERVSLPKRETDDSRAYAALLYAYGKFIVRRSERDPKFLQNLERDAQSLQAMKNGATARRIHGR